MMRISRYAAQAGVPQDTVRGAGMRRAQYARRIRAEFLRDLLDRRRWDGRTGESCGKQWTKTKGGVRKIPCMRASASAAWNLLGHRLRRTPPVVRSRCTTLVQA
jgi:hypothetical protein